MSNFLVTARKWRPQRFEDVVGQEHITQTLKNSIKSGKIAHAFIFSGPRGIGKTSTARILAKSLNCPNQKDYNPCNECEVCISITNGTNIDVIEIDGASNRRIDEIRTLRESVQYAPSMVKYKVYIIDEVHMLTTESFNALLKVLEEPPSNVIFIFATTDIHKVPATILSRCQRYEFRRLTTEEIKNHLIKIAQSEKIEYDEAAIHYIARRADGAMRDAQSLFDQIVVYSNGKVVLSEVADILNVIDVDLYFRVSDAIKNRQIEEAFKIVEEIYYRGWDLATFINDLIEHFRNILTVIVTNNADLIDESEITKEKYLNASKDFSSRDVLRILSFLSKTHYEIRQTTNQKLKLEIALAQLIELPKSAEIDELIQEIRKLKSSDLSQIKKTEPPIPELKQTNPMPSISNVKSADNSLPGLNLSEQNKKSDSQENRVSGPQSKISYDLPSSIQKIIDRWNEFIEYVQKNNQKLGTALLNSKIVRVEDNIVFVHSDQLKQDSSALDTNRPGLFNLSKSFWGTGLKFFVSNEPPGDKIIYTPKAKKTINQKEKDKDQLDDIENLSDEDKKIRKEIIDKFKATPLD